MVELVATYWISAAFCFAGWVFVLLKAASAASTRRRARGDDPVSLIGFIVERRARVTATAIAAVISCAALDQWWELNGATAGIAGLLSEGTAELLRRVSKLELVQAVIEKRLGVKLPTSEAGDGSLSETTIIKPPDNPARSDEA